MKWEILKITSDNFGKIAIIVLHLCKRPRTNGDFMKTVVVPITLFSDDTSGNLSKQFNLFDNYTVTPAAMSFDSRGSRNNTYFLCTANKKLSAVDMLPAIVDDLQMLENGIEVYSEIY
ncbi:hypothetical protein BD408DRAFT_435792 [Parasitella parasitica]|nr:hypothetical protein BD408DRAFT_435792 [Parasitella parasitica]